MTILILCHHARRQEDASGHRIWRFLGPSRLSLNSHAFSQTVLSVAFLVLPAAPRFAVVRLLFLRCRLIAFRVQPLWTRIFHRRFRKSEQDETLPAERLGEARE